MTFVKPTLIAFGFLTACSSTTCPDIPPTAELLGVGCRFSDTQFNVPAFSISPPSVCDWRPLTIASVSPSGSVTYHYGCA